MQRPNHSPLPTAFRHHLKSHAYLSADYEFVVLYPSTAKELFIRGKGGPAKGTVDNDGGLEGLQLGEVMSR